MLFLAKNIFLSLGHLHLTIQYNRAMLPGIAALSRIQTLRCILADRDSLTTIFNELLLTSKHGIRKFSCNCWAATHVFTTVAYPFQNIFFY
jgi:hypothetical protein